MKRDPITTPAATASGKPHNASAGRIKSISGGSPNFSSKSQAKGNTPPNDPYKK